MGQDKALLPYRGTTLLEHIARVVQEAAGNVAVIGDPDRYAGFVFPVYADKLAGYGPLGGVYTALSISKADWNLIVACDMPALTAVALSPLLEAAERTSRDCVVAVGSAGDIEPLCAVYHRRCLPMLVRAMDEKRLKMKDIVREIGPETVIVDSLRLANVNTPSDWAAEKL